MLDLSNNELSHSGLANICKLLRMSGMERSGRRRSIEADANLVNRVTAGSLGLASHATATRHRRSSGAGEVGPLEPMVGAQPQPTRIRDLVVSGNPVGNKVILRSVHAFSHPQSD